MHFLQKCINKNEGKIFQIFEETFSNGFLCRQKDMQRQLEKITDLVRLVVQKMEIHTEMEGDDTNRGGKNENFMKMQKFRQTLNVARRFTRSRSSNGNISNLFDQPEKV
jgi:hypothetical protein